MSDNPLIPIALAARVECPIAVTDEVLDAAGHHADEFEIEAFEDRDPNSNW